MARIVVVGGGYGGVTVAKGLDPLAEVILVEQKDRFVHHAAALRAAVEETWQHSIFMPYSNLLTHGTFIQGTVSRVEGTTVHVYGREPIEADYVVLASGSTYPFPAKYSSSRAQVAQARLEQLHENLRAARSVMLVGGGTVGIEFAGELAATHPDLNITIVEKEQDILSTPGYSPKLREEIKTQLAELGIRLITGSSLAYLPPFNVGELGHFTVQTVDGEEIQADLWFQCYGARANSGFLAGTSYEEALHPDGTIRVEPTLQVNGYANTYAVGDITDVRESKRADAARQQARVVIANISAQIRGEQPENVYRPTKEWVILPLGPRMGASQLLDDEGNTRILGADETAEIKGADLMVSVIRAQLNLP
ncbi:MULTISPECIES: FAD-dependent oxidoreductase [unclassified Schaalia]|uniref:FAD-dependent oxidoreductase n=1 Tax=unclassified Schaalia TaxID=2691889 RepID=UPI001E59CBB1|nr:MULTISPECIES: FAD-dependent oxidoreductase [unclassified Schaalia]MCD4549573.1 FAD-dependent oxidoreductase [Schaalia sp. lx-260]MCD4558156.1 FAD-dependent oxidoreductase [Schaalia sp. lx-100]